MRSRDGFQKTRTSDSLDCHSFGEKIRPTIMIFSLDKSVLPARIRKSIFAAMVLHLFFLMSLDAQIGSGFCSTD